MKYCKSIIFIILCFLQVSIVSGADYVIGQGENWESFEVSQDWFGTPSPTVDMTGGSVGNQYIKDFGTLNVFGGTTNCLYMYDSSTFNMYHGNVGGGFNSTFIAQGNSTINLFGGVLGFSSVESLYLLGHASLNIDTTDGFLGGLTIAKNSSAVNIYKGNVNYLALYDNSIADIYGGDVGCYGGIIEVDSTATLTIHGYNFVYDPYGIGELTGDGLNGVPIKIIGLPDPYTSDNIHLVPEPGTLALFTLSGFLALRRRTKR
jgi:hypothetical protein